MSSLPARASLVTRPPRGVALEGPQRRRAGPRGGAELVVAIEAGDLVLWSTSDWPWLTNLHTRGRQREEGGYQIRRCP